MKKTYNLKKLNKLTKEMFGEQYTFNKMSERERDMIKNEYNFKEFINAHQLTDKQLKDKEYINTLWENYIENTN
jgi:flagellar motor switch protein FliG